MVRCRECRGHKEKKRLYVSSDSSTFMMLLKTVINVENILFPKVNIMDSKASTRHVLLFNLLVSLMVFFKQLILYEHSQVKIL